MKRFSGFTLDEHVIAALKTVGMPASAFVNKTLCDALGLEPAPDLRARETRVHSCLEQRVMGAYEKLCAQEDPSFRFTIADLSKAAALYPSQTKTALMSLALRGDFGCIELPSQIPARPDPVQHWHSTAREKAWRARQEALRLEDAARKTAGSTQPDPFDE